METSPPSLLRGWSQLSESTGGAFWLANGRDDTTVVCSHEAKSVSEETTLEVDESDRQVLYTILAFSLKMSASASEVTVSRHVLSASRCAYSDFSTLSRERTLPPRQCRRRDLRLRQRAVRQLIPSPTCPAPGREHKLSTHLRTLPNLHYWAATRGRGTTSPGLPIRSAESTARRWSGWAHP